MCQTAGAIYGMKPTVAWTQEALKLLSSGSSRQHYCIDLDCPNKFYVKHTQDAQNVLTRKGWSLDT